MRVTLAAVLVAACSTEQVTQGEAELASVCDYPQVFGNASHTGLECPEQSGLRVVAKVLQDPGADGKNDGSGFVQFHYGPPLTNGDFVIVPSTAGFVSVEDRSPERYHVQALRWIGGVMSPGAQLKPVWTARTDWKPIDGVIGSFDYITNGYVQQFAPAIANGSVYIPERFGRLSRVSLTTGALQTNIDPLAGTQFAGDERAIVNNALSFDAAGNVYYTIVAWPLGEPGQVLRGMQPRGSWLVQVRPDNTVRLVDFPALAAAAGLPSRTDLCEWPFGTNGTPLPTGPSSRPPQFGCGTQRPAMNAPIAVDETTGNLIVYSYANNMFTAAFLTEISPSTMAPVRTYDTRGHALHGCGVRVPANNPNSSSGLQRRCAILTANGTTNIGVDPLFNSPVGFNGPDIVDSAPMVAPSGYKAICSYDSGFTFGGNFDARSFCIGFHPSGRATPQHEFGWEVTHSLLRTPEPQLLQDRNLYSDLELTVGRYDLSYNLEQTHTIPLDFDPVAIDFTDAHLPFGPRGETYAVNGDGHVYKFSPGIERPIEAVELTDETGSVRSISTLSNYWARDRLGRLYLSFAGTVYVLQGTGLNGTEQAAVDRALAQRPATAARLARSIEAKQRAAASFTLPPTPSL